jgi:hypothetical protein
MRLNLLAVGSVLWVVSAYDCAAQPRTPSSARSVRGSTIVSTRDPTATIRLPASVTYIGAHRWPLFDVADCEVHVFVDADAARRVQRIWYVQFEAYLPSEPARFYDYAEQRGFRAGACLSADS